jgi:predicted Zn-dependent protease
MKILIMIALISLMASTITLAEYNPATGENDLVFVNETQEVRIGSSLAKSIEKKFGLAKDDAISERVGRIGEKIASICDRPELTYSFKVLAGEELSEEERYNAFALPGGYVYIFKDMVEDMESDDELAAILAHEVGHIVAKHSVKKLQNSIGVAGLNLLGTVAKTDTHTQRKTAVAITELMMAYSRQAEFEADRLSIKYLKKAGFAPKAAISVIDKMLKKQLTGKIRRFRYFRTHPHTSERRAMLNKEIEGRFAFDDYINAPPETGKAFW